MLNDKNPILYCSRARGLGVRTAGVAGEAGCGPAQGDGVQADGAGGAVQEGEGGSGPAV